MNYIVIEKHTGVWMIASSIMQIQKNFSTLRRDTIQDNFIRRNNPRWNKKGFLILFEDDEMLKELVIKCSLSELNSINDRNIKRKSEELRKYFASKED
jgi:hypothetical protein